MTALGEYRPQDPRHQISLSSCKVEHGTIDIWHLSLAEHQVDKYLNLLSSDEEERAGCFHFERDHNRFVLARAQMRQVLALYLNVEPRHVAFRYSGNGKPKLGQRHSPSRLTFNLSHSRDRALLAITQNDPIGVDLEFVDSGFASESVARAFFSPAEVAALRARKDEERIRAFFSCWTRKESFLKAVGDGLSRPLDSFDVAFGCGVNPALLRIEGCSAEDLLRWRIYDMPLPEGYVGALTVSGSSHRLRWRSWLKGVSD